MTDPHNRRPATPGPSSTASSNTKWPWLIAASMFIVGTVVTVAPQFGSGTPIHTVASSQVDQRWVTAPVEADAPTPLVTSEQYNAVAKAREYLSLMAFSKPGLIDQLEFEGFSNADATYAVNKLEADGAVNWNEQAAKKAGEYRSMMAFSRQGLIEQLEFEGFTASQAIYGVDHARS